MDIIIVILSAAVVVLSYFCNALFHRQEKRLGIAECLIIFWIGLLLANAWILAGRTAPRSYAKLVGPWEEAFSVYLFRGMAIFAAFYLLTSLISYLRKLRSGKEEIS